MRKMKDSGIEWIGEIPEEWEIRKTKQIFSVFNGSTPKSDNEEYWGGGIIWITPAEMGEHIALIKNSKRTLSNLGLSSCGTTIVPENSIIISSRAPIGQVSIAGVELCTNQGCKSLVSKCNINKKYFFYFFRSQSEILNMLGKGTTFLELSSLELEGFLIPFPSIPEQHRIAAFLEAKCVQIDKCIELTRQSIDKLKAYRMSVITEAVTKGLNPDVPMKDSGIEWIGEIPEEWEVKSIRHIIKSIFNGTTAQQLDEYDDNSIPVTRIETISTGEININKLGYVKKYEVDKKYKLHIGDILFSNINSLKMIGNCAIYNNDIGLYVGMNLLKISPSINIVPKYLYFVISSIAFKEIVKSNAKPAINQASISQNSLIAIKWGFPKLQEQQRIAAFLDTKCAEIDAIIVKKQELLDKLAAYKKSLIFECVTGKREISA